jgi:hypothetical protein
MKRDLLSGQRAHDYAYLIERWRAVAERAGLVMRRFAHTGEYPLYYVRSKGLPKRGTIYISAGIHGDEPGATEGFITWAEKNTRVLRQRPFLMAPCINPWGLVNNSRVDSMGRDLNRAFQDDAVPEIAALRRLIGKREYAMSLTLHEDYDGVGIYIYELRGSLPYWGEALLEAARPFVPPDGRTQIEGREAEGGLVRPVPDMELFKRIGTPEALYMFMGGCQRVYTIETPSEYGLDRRVAAHVAVVEECMRRVGR